MWKGIALGAATLVVLGTTYLSAQPARDRPDGQRPPAISREDATAFLDARVAGLHSGLQLTPDQERLWPAFEKAYRERAKQRMERRFAGGGRQQQTDDPVARLQRRADAMTQEGAALKALADAAAPLWQSFDDGQKRRFTVLSRPDNRQANAGAPDERAGPGRAGGRDGDGRGFGRGQRGFGQGGRDDYGYGREGRGFGRGGRDDDGYGRGGRDDDGYGREGRGYGRNDYGSGREGRGFGRSGRDDYGYGRDGRGFRRGGPGGRNGEESGSDRDYGRGGRSGRSSREDEERL